MIGCALPDFSATNPSGVEAAPDAADPLAEPRPAVGFTITSLAPDRGLPKGLEVVEIRGGGFRDDSRVFFGGSEATEVTVSSEGRLFAVTPPHSPGWVTVRIINIDGSEARAKKGFLYVDQVVVTDLSPREGPATGGIPVALHGAGFSEAEAVLFDGRAALKMTVIGDDTIHCILPSHAVGDADLLVVTPAGNGRVRRAFHFFEAPRVSGLSPLAAPVSGGGTLTLTGAGLGDGTEISIGGIPATALASQPDGTRIVVRIPPGPAGPADLSVTTQYGAISLPGAFTWLAESPTGEFLAEFLNVWPATGPAEGGGEVLLVATGLAGLGPDDLAVSFGDQPATVLDVLPGQNIVLTTAPAGIPGQRVDVTLTRNSTAEVLSDAYAYVQSLQVSGVTPAQGPVAGGTAIEISGVGFSIGTLEVFVGALPVRALEVVSDTLVRAVTAAGSPGFGDVRVNASGRAARLEQGFEFRADETRVWAVVPEEGAIAGNTWVTIYGTNLPDYLNVHFGETPAQWVQGQSPTEVVLRSPRAEAVGAVDLRISAGPLLDETLTGTWTYFDPTARWGGTWGRSIDGSVNATVLASGSEDPIEGALIVLGTGSKADYKGYTDDRGQVTLSGRWLQGRQTITAAMDGAGATSVVAFDAENVTLFLSTPSNPGGGNGVQLPPGNVVGTVHGAGKYMVLPPWDCAEVGVTDDGHCGACATDQDCPTAAPACTAVSNQPPFCSSSCAVDEDCPADYVCMTAAKASKRCVPSPGRPEARCNLSSTHILTGMPAADPDNTVDLEAGETAFLLSNVRLGEVAVYCLGGAYRKIHVGTDQERAVFLPTVLGVARHEFVPPGADPDTGLPLPPHEVEVWLDIPLSRSVTLSVGRQPLRTTGPHRTRVRGFLGLGSDGYIPIAERDLDPKAEMVRIKALPQELSGDLYDASYVFHGAAVTNSTDELPSSEVLRANLGTLDDGPYLFFDGAAWQTPISGYSGDVQDLLATAPNDVFAATTSGGVIHFDGNGWSAQPVPAGPPLNALASDLAGGIVVVGDAGRVLRWNGAGWAALESGTDQALRGVTAIGPDALVAVGSYVITEWNGAAFVPSSFGPPKDLNAVWSQGASDAWAVGANGVTLRRDQASGVWTAATVPYYKTLHDIWGTSDGLRVAVGQDGGVLMGTSDGDFDAVQTPTTRTLRGVSGRSGSDIFAVGDAATVMHFDGSQWTLVTEERAELSLRGIDAAGETLFAMGAHAVHLDPFLQIPDFQSPARGQVWNRRTVQWSAPPSAPASFNSIRIYGPTGVLAWSIMAPGALRDFELPDLNAIDGLDVVPGGQKQTILYRVQHPSFDIDAYDNRAFSLMEWRAWALDSFTFGVPEQDVPVSTVPGT